VLDKQVQLDRSGAAGHCWKNVSGDEIPANVRQEIECEIIDGKREECGGFVASNGLHYRWW
jgi:hypothetical protein